MDISGATTTTQSSSGATTSSLTATSLGKDDFLKLFVAQLQAQDPLNPMDSTNFTSQLAQFSSLEQLTNLNSSLTDMLASQTTLQNTMTTNLIGKKVLVTGNTISLNGQADLKYSLGGDAASVTVKIYDSSGALVRTSAVSSQSAGSNSYSWDGKDQTGNALPAGQYTFTVEAANSTGQAISATALMTGTVTGVIYSNNVAYLTIDGTTQVQLGDIIEIQGGA